MVVVTGCFTRESFLSSCQSGGAHAIWNAIGGSPVGKKMEKKEPHCNLSGACHQILGKCHMREDHATSMPDDSAAQIADSWRADIQWLGGLLRSHLRSDDSLLLLRGLVTIG